MRNRQKNKTTGSQPAFTDSKLRIKALEKDAKYVQS